MTIGSTAQALESIDVHFDKLIQKPFYNTWELAFSTLAEIRSKKLEGERLCIRTDVPEHPVLKFFLSGQDELFLQNELRVRKSSTCPPLKNSSGLNLGKKDHRNFLMQ
jgi:primosomal protein N'